MAERWPGEVTRMARRIAADSARPGRRRFTKAEALEIAVGRLRQYGYLKKRSAGLTARGRRHWESKRD